MLQGPGHSLAVMGARLTLLGAAVLTGIAAVDAAQDPGHTPDAVLVSGITPTATAPSAAPAATHAAVPAAMEEARLEARARPGAARSRARRSTRRPAVAPHAGVYRTFRGRRSPGAACRSRRRPRAGRRGGTRRRTPRSGRPRAARRRPGRPGPGRRTTAAAPRTGPTRTRAAPPRGSRRPRRSAPRPRRDKRRGRPRPAARVRRDAPVLHPPCPRPEPRVGEPGQVTDDRHAVDRGAVPAGEGRRAPSVSTPSARSNPCPASQSTLGGSPAPRRRRPRVARSVREPDAGDVLAALESVDTVPSWNRTPCSSCRRRSSAATTCPSGRSSARGRSPRSDLAAERAPVAATSQPMKPAPTTTSRAPGTSARAARGVVEGAHRRAAPRCGRRRAGEASGGRCAGGADEGVVLEAPRRRRASTRRARRSADDPGAQAPDDVRGGLRTRNASVVRSRARRRAPPWRAAAGCTAPRLVADDDDLAGVALRAHASAARSPAMQAPTTTTAAGCRHASALERDRLDRAHVRGLLDGVAQRLVDLVLRAARARRCRRARRPRAPRRRTGRGPGRRRGPPTTTLIDFSLQQRGVQVLGRRPTPRNSQSPPERRRARPPRSRSAGHRRRPDRDGALDDVVGEPAEALDLDLDDVARLDRARVAGVPVKSRSPGRRVIVRAMSATR